MARVTHRAEGAQGTRTHFFSEFLSQLSGGTFPSFIVSAIPTARAAAVSAQLASQGRHFPVVGVA